jgi:hypothetical protein
MASTSSPVPLLSTLIRAAHGDAMPGRQTRPEHVQRTTSMTTPTTIGFQYARVEARRCDAITAILNEAFRLDGFCPHVPNPRPPQTLYGSRDALLDTLKTFVEEPHCITWPCGKTLHKRRRHDARGLVECVTSFPVPMSELLASRNLVLEKVRPWVRDNLEFLCDEWGGRLKLVLLHLDEAYPHLHAYAVGDAQQIHPGLRMEMVDGRRIIDPRERIRRHKQGLKDFLDRYFCRVGSKHGLMRGDGRRRGRRIRERQVYIALDVARKAAARNQDAELLQVINKALGMAQTEVDSPERQEHGIRIERTRHAGMS